MKLYGLYSRKQMCLMGFRVYSNSESDFCVGVMFELDKYHGDTIWCTPDEQIAHNVVQQGPTEWFNADYKNPYWNKEYYGDLVPVRLDLYDE